MYNCPRCGAPVTPMMNNCPNCGLSFRLPQQNKSKASSLSIVALVLGILTVTSLLGFIIGLIDLIKGNKNEKHYGSWIAIIWFGIVFVISIFAFDDDFAVYNEDNTTQVTQETQSYKVNQPSTVQQSSSANTNNNYSAVYDNVTVKYQKDEFARDSLGNEVYLVYYKITNNSNRGRAFTYTFDDKVYLNGLELEKEYFYDSQYCKNYSLEVMPGNTITVASAFKMRDEVGKMNIQVKPFMGSTMLLNIELNVTKK